MRSALESAAEHAGWKDHARRLAAFLAERDDLRAPEWRAAVAAVPRHVLVPYAYEQDPSTGDWSGFDTADKLDRIYSTETFVTALETVNGHQQPVSSSTKPDLMLRMLETLDVHDDHRVLEIGTGSGYNAALLAERLGNDKVLTVDIDQQLVTLARGRLAAVGYHPTLAAVDGADGLPAHAPFDRIIATCSVSSVPWAWAEQLTEDGLILVDLKLATSAGNLVLLRRAGDRLEGRFTTRWAAFMAMRRAVRAIPVQHADPARGERSRATSAPAVPWRDAPVVWFLAQLRLPRGVSFGYDLDPATLRPVASRLSAPDGSWARINHGGGQVTEAGPTPIWPGVEWACEQWIAAGRPAWSQLALTVTSDGGHQIWVDEPTGTYRWGI